MASGAGPAMAPRRSARPTTLGARGAAGAKRAAAAARGAVVITIRPEAFALAAPAANARADAPLSRAGKRSGFDGESRASWAESCADDPGRPGVAEAGCANAVAVAATPSATATPPTYREIGVMSS